MFVEHFHLETCASNIKAQNKLYKLYKIFWLLFPFQIKIAIEPGAFHYTFWCHDQLLNLGKDNSKEGNSQDNSTQTKLVWVTVSDNLQYNYWCLWLWAPTKWQFWKIWTILHHNNLRINWNKLNTTSVGHFGQVWWTFNSIIWQNPGWKTWKNVLKSPRRAEKCKKCSYFWSLYRPPLINWTKTTYIISKYMLLGMSTQNNRPIGPF